MPRIQDIGAFNAVREAGLAKLMPAIPRITVGMGTCGRGNGAEEVYHASDEAIERSGLDVLLAGVGCFGSCFQEPLVSVRLPGNPLVMLRRVQANDAGAHSRRHLHAETCRPIWSTARSRNGITSPGNLRYGQGYPEIPLLERSSVLQGPEEDRAAQLRAHQSRRTSRNTSAVGGYQALYKVLIDGRPES